MKLIRGEVHEARVRNHKGQRLRIFSMFGRAPDRPTPGEPARVPPPSATAAVALADEARDAGSWVAAAASYAAGLAIYPEWPDIWVQFGHALKESGQRIDAENAYRRALALDPGNPDTHLQLGHVLKIQGRKDEAGQAYVQALSWDPLFAAAREELSNLGWSISQINRSVVGARILPGGLPPAPSALSPQAKKLSGAVTSVGTDYVSGLIRGGGEADPTIRVVCRSIRAEIGQVVIASPKPGDDVPFEIRLPPDLAISEKLQLHIMIEPIGIELKNSPIVLPGVETADILTRVERLEMRVAQYRKDFDTDALITELYQTSVARIDAVIAHQRMTFERQLLMAGGRNQHNDSLDMPASIVVHADDHFDGFGWFPVEDDDAGGRHRWMGKEGFISVRLAGTEDLFLTLMLNEAMSDHLPPLLSVRVGGTAVQSWILRLQNGAWRLSALIPSELRHGDGVVGVAILSPDAVYSSDRDQRRLSVAFSELSLLPVPRLSRGEMIVNPESIFVVEFGAVTALGKQRSAIMFSGICEPTNLNLVIKIAGDFSSDIIVLVNGRDMAVSFQNRAIVVRPPNTVLRIDSNLLQLVGTVTSFDVVTVKLEAPDVASCAV